MRVCPVVLKAVAGVALAAALAAVFAAYLQPGIIFTLANQLWACF